MDYGLAINEETLSVLLEESHIFSGLVTQQISEFKFVHVGHQLVEVITTQGSILIESSVIDVSLGNTIPSDLIIFESLSTCPGCLSLASVPLIQIGDIGVSDQEYGLAHLVPFHVVEPLCLLVPAPYVGSLALNEVNIGGVDDLLVRIVGSDQILCNYWGHGHAQCNCEHDS